MLLFHLFHLKPLTPTVKLPGIILGDADVYVYISAPDKSGACTVESHIAENSSLKTEDLESLLTAISSQMTSERFASLGLSAQNSYDVDSMSAADYLDQKNGTESIGFDANFAIQYGYSIVVMILWSARKLYHSLHRHRKGFQAD